MGQPVTVVQKSSSKPGVVRYEINRSITGMDHERYLVGDEVSGERPPDGLARRLFELGGINGVHINSNIITLHLGREADTDDIKDLIADMFIYYGPDVEIPSFPS